MKPTNHYLGNFYTQYVLAVACSWGVRLLVSYSIALFMDKLLMKVFIYLSVYFHQ